MNKKDFPIHFLMTGGTIDSYYEGTKDTAVPLKKSCIPDFIKSLKLYNETKFSEICMKDSRNMTMQDLNNLLKEIEKSDCKHIIITHGTYTMPDTARYIDANLKSREKTIILTASMIPITGFSPSDGPFSLGYAISEVQNLKNGVYACVNGRVFQSNEIMKIVSEGRFTSVFTK